MHISHHGAVSGVTGSCHQLSLNDGRGILIDCGLFQGDETSSDQAAASQPEINFGISQLQALVVTHVHIDHVGRIPYLLAAGFTKPIFCSEPSALLLPKVIEDALKVGFTRNKALIDRVIDKLKKLIIPMPYGQWQQVIAENEGSSVAIKLKPAGHILGSAYVECDVKEQNEKGGKQRQRVVFSGDLGAPYAPLLPAPKPPYGCDVLVIESTYGDKNHQNHQNRRQRREQLRKVLEKALADNGVVLIPAFSIGRTQELLYELEELIHRHQLSVAKTSQPIEVIVDSPLAASFTESYRQLKSHWDKEARGKVARGRHPLSFEELYTVDSHQQHLDTVNYLKNRPRPCIVIAASGMCAGGRIVNYLKALIEDKRSDILFVGYQAKGTPGRDIQQYGPKGGYVMLDNNRYTIKAGIHILSGYSAHADQKDLLNFVKRMRKKPKEVRIIHGDDEAKLALKQKMIEHFDLPHIHIPTK